jgi:hypothetical protein
VSSAKVSAEAYEPLVAQIAVSHAKAATYPQENGNETFAEELGDVESKLAAGEYDDNDIATIVLEVKGITNRYLMADAVANGSRKSPIDVTDRVVVQASFENNAYTPWTVSTAPASITYNIAEFSNTTFDMYQVLYGMPAGVYQLQAQAYYRYGSSSAHNSAYNNGSIKRNAKLYIAHGATEMQTADVMAISDDPSEIHQMGQWSTKLYDGHPVPEDMVAACEAMDTLHKYMPKDEYNKVEINTIEIGDLTIGIKKETKRSNDWTVIGGFNLYYLGDGQEEEDVAVEETTSNEAIVVAIYNANGIRIATMQKGINLLRMSDGTTVKVVQK